MNRKGEIGSPCRIPLEGIKVVEGVPRIEKKAEEVRDIIHRVHKGLKPKAIRVFSIYSQLSL